MAQGSGCSIHIQTNNVPWHPECYELAEMGFIPSGAYRNREYAEANVSVKGTVSRALQDILYDPQTSGGLLAALPEESAANCLQELQAVVPQAHIVGSVTEQKDSWIYLY